MLGKVVQHLQVERLGLKFKPMLPQQHLEDCIMVDILEIGLAVEVQDIMEVAVEQMMVALDMVVVAEVR
jgi:hypothetical protein